MSNLMLSGRAASALRICHITTVHNERDIRIFVKECRSLAARGAEVHLIVPSDGAPYECVNGVHVHRLPRPAGRLQRISSTVAKAAREALRLRADIYHFHDPELIPMGLLLRVAGRKVIYDVHEDFPGTVFAKHYLPRWLQFPIHLVSNIFEQAASRCLSGMVAATPRIADKFPAGMTTVVNNFPILEEFSAPAAVDYCARPQNVVYVGGISEGRGIDLMLRAVAHTRASRMLLAGRFAPQSLLGKLESTPDWGRVDFRGWVDRAEVAALLDQARVGLLLLRPERNHVESQPIKLFEYMASGLPVVASDFPYWRRFVRDSEFGPCGVLVDPADPVAAARAIDHLMEHPEEAQVMGGNGLRAVRERFNWSHEFDRLVDFYRKIAA
jgi:glycosyltransferase involved in cell wall biosynthesis